MIPWFLTSKACQVCFMLFVFVHCCWWASYPRKCQPSSITGQSQRNLWRDSGLEQLLLPSRYSGRLCRLTGCLRRSSQPGCHNYPVELSGDPGMVHLALLVLQPGRKNHLSPFSETVCFLAISLSSIPAKLFWWRIYWPYVLLNTRLMTLCLSWGKSVALWENLKTHLLNLVFPSWNLRGRKDSFARENINLVIPNTSG